MLLNSSIDFRIPKDLFFGECFGLRKFQDRMGVVKFQFQLSELRVKPMLCSIAENVQVLYETIDKTVKSPRKFHYQTISGYLLSLSWL